MESIICQESKDFAMDYIMNLSWQQIEKLALQAHLIRNKGNVVKASETLIISDPTFYSKCKKYKIDHKDFKLDKSP